MYGKLSRPAPREADLRHSSGGSRRSASKSRRGVARPQELGIHDLGCPAFGFLLDFNSERLRV